MIIDTHYHSARFPSDETAARNLVKRLSVDYTRLGVGKVVDDVIPVWRDRMEDINGDKLVKRMDEDGIDITVLLIMDNISMSTEAIMRLHEEAAQKVSAHPGRLISLAGIDPRRPEAPALFRKCINDFNMKGLKWHPDLGYYPNSEESYKVLKVANELGVPLLTHCSPLSFTRAKFAHPIYLDDIALDFPNLQIIAAHSGLMWWHEWAALAQMKENINGDLAMWQFIADTKPALFRRHLREMLDITGHKQILFGTDGPYTEGHVSNKRWLEIMKRLKTEDSDGIKFSGEEVDAMLGGNAARIFNLK